MAGLYVFLGGGLGATLRWVVGLYVAAPWGTWVANVVGSFVLAFLMHPGHELSDTWKLALGTGMMGGFTTYSTFNLDVLSALQRGDVRTALTVLLTTVAVCLLSGAAGWWCAGLLRTATP